jgi:hypothetical protein
LSKPESDPSVERRPRVDTARAVDAIGTSRALVFCREPDDLLDIVVVELGIREQEPCETRDVRRRKGGTFPRVVQGRRILEHGKTAENEYSRGGDADVVPPAGELRDLVAVVGRADRDDALPESRRVLHRRPS